LRNWEIQKRREFIIVSSLGSGVDFGVIGGSVDNDDSMGGYIGSRDVGSPTMLCSVLVILLPLPAGFLVE
jgi:hypothetical protein